MRIRASSEIAPGTCEGLAVVAQRPIDSPCACLGHTILPARGLLEDHWHAHWHDLVLKGTPCFAMDGIMAMAGPQEPLAAPLDPT